MAQPLFVSSGVSVVRERIRLRSRPQALRHPSVTKLNKISDETLDEETVCTFYDEKLDFSAQNFDSLFVPLLISSIGLPRPVKQLLSGLVTGGVPARTCQSQVL